MSDLSLHQTKTKRKEKRRSNQSESDLKTSQLRSRHIRNELQANMATYTQVVLVERPTGSIIPGQTFKLKQEKRIEESDLKDGQVLIETRYLGMEPAMRGWLNGMYYVSSFPGGELVVSSWM